MDGVGRSTNTLKNSNTNTFLDVVFQLQIQ